jgi:hypothetical protein
VTVRTSGNRFSTVCYEATHDVIADRVISSGLPNKSPRARDRNPDSEG